MYICIVAFEFLIAFNIKILKDNRYIIQTLAPKIKRQKPIQGTTFSAVLLSMTSQFHVLRSSIEENDQHYFVAVVEYK